MTDVQQALRSGAPPPATPVGGVQAIMPGTAQDLQLDVDPGDYVVWCQIPAPDGTAHSELGMIGQVTVG